MVRIAGSSHRNRSCLGQRWAPKGISAGEIRPGCEAGEQAGERPESISTSVALGRRGESRTGRRRQPPSDDRAHAGSGWTHGDDRAHSSSRWAHGDDRAHSSSRWTHGDDRAHSSSRWTHGDDRAHSSSRWTHGGRWTRSSRWTRGSGWTRAGRFQERFS
jgi:hypothetical protein